MIRKRFNHNKHIKKLKQICVRVFHCTAMMNQYGIWKKASHIHILTNLFTLLKSIYFLSQDHTLRLLQVGTKFV